MTYLYFLPNLRSLKAFRASSDTATLYDPRGQGVSIQKHYTHCEDDPSQAFAWLVYPAALFAVTALPSIILDGLYIPGSGLQEEGELGHCHC